MCLSIYCPFVVIKQKKIVSVCQLTASTKNNCYSPDFSIGQHFSVICEVSLSFYVFESFNKSLAKIEYQLATVMIILLSVSFIWKMSSINVNEIKNLGFSLRFLVSDRYKLLRLLYQQHHLVCNITAKDLLPIYLSLIGKP